MVFNAVCGNDDDHLRNHAAVYDHDNQSWRLSQAFDVVPNPEFNPLMLALAVNRTERLVSRESILRDVLAFGFESREDAMTHLDRTLQRIRAGFDISKGLLDDPLRKSMRKRMQDNLKLLRR